MEKFFKNTVLFFLMHSHAVNGYIIHKKPALLSGNFLGDMLFAIIINNLRNIIQTFAALRLMSTPTKNLAHSACILARLSKFFIVYCITDADIHTKISM